LTEGHGPPTDAKKLAGDLTLPTLHEVIQAAMGWTDTHLHRFRTGADHRSAYLVTSFDLEEGEDGVLEDDERTYPVRVIVVRSGGVHTRRWVEVPAPEGIRGRRGPLASCEAQRARPVASSGVVREGLSWFSPSRGGKNVGDGQSRSSLAGGAGRRTKQSSSSLDTDTGDTLWMAGTARNAGPSAITRRGMSDTQAG
jgi:hypothetical protein